MEKIQNVVIAAAKRTPVGAFQGSISSVSGPDLGAKVIGGILEETMLNPTSVNEVIMGNVLAAGLGQAPARQAALESGLPDTVECITINKMCGSGLKAAMLATQAIQVGDADIIIAGGFENMSQAPYLLSKGRDGYRLGHGELIDSMITDGLWDVYNDTHMGNCAEICARDRHYSKEDQNDFAKESYTRALDAQKTGAFNDEIIAVDVMDRKRNTVTINIDEEPGRANFDKMDKLQPAFEKDGTVTAGNASKINDGAAGVLLISETKATELGFTPLVRIISQASAAQEPEWFTTAPIKAISKVLEKAGMEVADIDLWEINEAFAPVAMAVMEDFNLDHSKVNVNGGAIALGHPIGASGARTLTTLIHALKSQDVTTGLVTLCIGGGEASAMIVEKV